MFIDRQIETTRHFLNRSNNRTMKRFSRPSRKSDHSISIHNTFPQLLHHYFITFFVTLLIVESRIESSEAFCSWQKPMNNFLNAQKSRKSTVKYVWSFLRIRERSEITKVNASGKGQRRNAKRLARQKFDTRRVRIYIYMYVHRINSSDTRVTLLWTLRAIEDIFILRDNYFIDRTFRGRFQAKIDNRERFRSSLFVFFFLIKKFN